MLTEGVMLFVADCAHFSLIGIGEHVVKRNAIDARTGRRLHITVQRGLSDILSRYVLVLRLGNRGQWLKQTQRLGLDGGSWEALAIECREIVMIKAQDIGWSDYCSQSGSW